MSAIALTREVRALFGEPRRMDAAKVACCGPSFEARKSALLRMRIFV
jgi:hypothetical protein